VEIRCFQGGTAEDHVAEFKAGVADRHPVGGCFFAPPGNSEEYCSHHLLVRGTDLAKNPTDFDIQKFKARWVRLRSPPPMAMLGKQGLDPVESDIMDIPSVIEEVEDSWADPSSLNRLTCQRFSQCLAALLHAAQTRSSSEIDVLVFGIENSLWLGQQFAADLNRVFPRLNVMAIS
jgi:hypothetical protein